MSVYSSSASQQSPSRSGAGRDGRRSGGACRDRRGGGERIEEYQYAFTDEQAKLLTERGLANLIRDIKRKSGVEISFDTNTLPAPYKKAIIIRGGRSQIEAAVRIINRRTGEEGTIVAQSQAFWERWVAAAFPDLETRAYFLPPVCVSPVPITRDSIAGQDVLVLQKAPGQAGQSNHPAKIPPTTTCQDSDLRDHAAIQRIFLCLQKMYEHKMHEQKTCEQKEDILVGISQLDFGQYLGEPCYAAAVASLPLPKTLSNATSSMRQGDFDVLLIHRLYGLVVCEVKSFGNNLTKLNMSQEDICNAIRRKLKDAITQLNKSETVLSHLVSDIASGLKIIKTIAFPNLTGSQIQKAITEDPQLTQDLSRCLGTTSDPTYIAGLCLCSDQLSDPKTPWDVSSYVLRELGHWWQRRVAGAGPDSHMTLDLYKKLVARFCGPATSVTVPCTCPPRVSVKTLGQAVWWTGECYTAVITLFPEQVHLLHTAPPTLFVTGPPGTGKTVVLLLMAIQWLRCGHHVYIVSTWWRSLAACNMLDHLLRQTITEMRTEGTPGQPHLLQYEFDDEKNVEKAVNDLSQAVTRGSLHVITDETVREYKSHFQSFCKKLLSRVPRLHLWAASCYHELAPTGWQVEHLTRPLRSPPAVVREVQKSRDMSRDGAVREYSEREVPDHTDGPPVKRVYHGGEGHYYGWLGDCDKCGREVASFLRSLRLGSTGIPTTNVTNTSRNITPTSVGATPSCLMWKDMLVLYWETTSDNSGFVTGMSEAGMSEAGMTEAGMTEAGMSEAGMSEAGLREAGIPVRVMKEDDMEDVATARSDVVWVADGRRIQGLERKVIVCLGTNDMSVSLHNMSRCTSQLVIVSPEPNDSSDQ